MAVVSYRNQLTKHHAEHDFTKKQIEEKRRRCEELEESLFEVCGSEDLETAIKKLEQEIESLQDCKGPHYW